MELKWYIDSWAPTEGVAFVSKREPCEDPWALEHTATLMIRAPDFEPRPVDRTFAFGAARRGFQERFAIEGLTEYGFDSLEYLTTFVSRIYLGSGPGTGGDGGLPVEGGPILDGGDDDAFLLSRMEELSDSKATFSESSWGAFFVEQLKASPAKRFTEIQRSLNEYVFLSAFLLLNESAREARGSLDWFRSPVWPIPVNRIEQAINVPLPRRYVQSLQLPDKLLSFDDVMSFIAADSTFGAQLSMAEVLSLLLATAIIFSPPTVELYYFRNWQFYEEHWEFWHQRFSATHAQFIVDWLPFDKLPSELEQTLQNWNQLTFEEQRRNPHQG